MDVYSIGFTQKSAETFFELLKRTGIRRLIDVRLHNSSQLAAFSKQDDLVYFLRVICSATYRHEPLLAPTQAMLDHYRKEKGGWAEYERQFLALLAERHAETHFSPDLFEPTSVLLCSEATAEHCHRRLVLEYLQARWGNLHITHL
ncbi:MAG: DUF488 domain-containing protein [Ktedonobacterales bacterium]